MVIMIVNNLNFVEVIYREDNEGREIENNIFEMILKKGIWVLYGKFNGIYECLNVGKSVNVGSEILYDIGCLKFLRNEENKEGNLYINQFGEYKNFNYISGMTQEFLYPYISKNYKELIFIYVWNNNDAAIEKALAWKLHAIFWRDKKPYKKPKENFYKDNEKEILNQFNNYMTDINSVCEKICELL